MRILSYAPENGIEIIRCMPARHYTAWFHRILVSRAVLATPTPRGNNLHLFFAMGHQQVDAAIPGNPDNIALKASECLLFYLSQQIHTAVLDKSEDFHDFFHIEISLASIRLLYDQLSSEKYKKLIASIIKKIEAAKPEESFMLSEWPVTIDSFMLLLIENIRKEQLKEPALEYYRYKQCDLLIKHFLKQYIQREDLKYNGLTSNEVNIIDDVKAHVKQNMDQPLNLKILSGQFDLNSRKLANGFELINVIPLPAFVILMRMELAVQLLSDDSIQRTDEEIASALGYSSEELFRREFEQYWGCSPARFRQ